MRSMLKSYIIIIILKNNKYFIMKTNQENFILEKHFDKNKYKFTQENEPISYKYIEMINMFDLNNMVKEYMYKYGIENVRGGSYIQNILSQEQLNVLQSEFWTYENKCSQCGGLHDITQCQLNVSEEQVVNINNKYPNNIYKTPVVSKLGYVYYTGCCVCGKNVVGIGKTTSGYHDIFTNPNYKMNDKITKLVVCCSCSTTITGKKLLDTNKELYEIEAVKFNPNDNDISK